MCPELTSSLWIESRALADSCRSEPDSLISLEDNLRASMQKPNRVFVPRLTPADVTHALQIVKLIKIYCKASYMPGQEFKVMSLIKIKAAISQQLTWGDPASP